MITNQFEWPSCCINDANAAGYAEMRRRNTESNFVYLSLSNSVGGAVFIDGKPFYGAVATDAATGKRICYEVCKDFKFWVIWNDHGDKGYFCPEPCTWIIDAPNQPIPGEESGYRELAPGESHTVTEKIYTA